MLKWLTSKKLDKKDIESFVFKCTEDSYDSNDGYPSFHYKFIMLDFWEYELEYFNWHATGSNEETHQPKGPDYKFDYKHSEETRLVKIKRDKYQIFSGIINNKKEFKILLKQLIIL
jgi:hypothetical protein